MSRKNAASSKSRSSDARSIFREIAARKSSRSFREKQTHEIDHLDIALTIAQARDTRSDAALCEVLRAWNGKASVDLDRAAPESKSSVYKIDEDTDVRAIEECTEVLVTILTENSRCEDTRKFFACEFEVGIHRLAGDGESMHE
jgi:hypothetical protein